MEHSPAPQTRKATGASQAAMTFESACQGVAGGSSGTVKRRDMMRKYMAPWICNCLSHGPRGQRSRDQIHKLDAM